MKAQSAHVAETPLVHLGEEALSPRPVRAGGLLEALRELFRSLLGVALPRRSGILLKCGIRWERRGSWSARLRVLIFAVWPLISVSRKPALFA
jgi:hypothetical protein